MLTAIARFGCQLRRYPPEEHDTLMEEVRQALTVDASPQTLPPTRDDCVAAFQHRVRAYLHIVLCFSPVGDRLRLSVRTFPGLVNNCTIDW